jgi:hypothetical protein
MNENEMGYRGSKSAIFAVKEQRVDGSYSGNKKKVEPGLRYTLMAFERKYPIKIPSKQLNISSFTTLAVYHCADAANGRKHMQPSIKNNRTFCVQSCCAGDNLFNNTYSINP